MNDNTGRQILVASFFGTIAVVVWQEIHFGHAPRPQRFVSAGLLYGILGVAAPILSYPLASLFGVGIFLTMLYAYYDQSSVVASALGQNPDTPPGVQGESGFGGLGQAGGGAGGGGGSSF